MRAVLIQSICAGQLIMLVGLLATTAGESSTTGDAKDPMAAIIAALRVEEARYQDLEYLIRTTSRKAGLELGVAADEFTALETRHVVLQGDRVFYRGSSDDRSMETPVRQEQVSAYDGEKARTVIAGNCVNIHAGRFEHPDVLPAHCISLLHSQLNFPLSVYLAGTEAIHSHPKYGRYPPEGGGSIYEFTKVVARYDGEDLVNGRRCLKIRCDRWTSLKNPAFLQYLWLAPDRNYLCVKEIMYWPGSRYGDLPLHQMHVEKLREVAPGRWFPVKITVKEYEPEALEQKKQVVQTLRTTMVARISLEPHHEQAFFHDVELPSDLPFFSLENGKILGPKAPEPQGGNEGDAKLKEVVAKLKDNEAKFANLEVKARVNYKYVGNDVSPSVLMDQFSLEHSVLQGKLAYFSSRGGHSDLGVNRAEDFAVEAFDGRWIRSCRGTKTDGQAGQSSAFLRDRGDAKAEGRLDGIPVHRPHILLLRDMWIYGPLADFVVSRWLDKRNGYRQRFRYCGQQEFEGHPCILLHAEVYELLATRPSSSTTFWLAADRDFIPVRIESYSFSDGSEPVLTEIDTCSDFRELAPGVWYPWHARQVALNNRTRMQGIVTLSWRRDLQIETVSLAPEPKAELFHELVVPQGTTIEVIDRQNKRVRSLVQAKDGNIEAPQTQ